MTPGFYNANANRSYPFLRGTVDQPVSGPVTLLNLDDRVIVDAGFVLGPKSQFNADQHTIYLARIRRQADVFFYDFESDAPELFGVTLTFTRHLLDADDTVEFVDSGHSGISDSSLSYSSGPCEEPLWSGFLVSGNMEALAAQLASGTLDRGIGGAVVEPGLIQNLAGSFITKVVLANDDRTRTSAPADCPAIVWPYDVGVVHLSAPCLLGQIRFQAGYNATVRQTSVDNSITFGAVVGAGAGEPCEQVPRFDGETPPAGSTHLDGGPGCSGALRSINGVGGRLLPLLAGTGVTITSLPAENKVLVNVNMAGLAVCSDHVSQVSESC